MAAPAIPSFDEFLKADQVPTFDDFVAQTAPKTDLGTGRLEKPLALPSIPRPPASPNDIAAPPPVEQSFLGIPTAPAPRPTPFNLPITPTRRPVQSAGPIGALPEVGSTSVPTPPDQPPAAPPVNVPMATTPQLTPNIPGYGAPPPLSKPPLPAGLRPQSESINTANSLLASVGISPEDIAASGDDDKLKYLADYKNLMQRWGLPQFKKKFPVGDVQPTAAQLGVAQSMEGVAGSGLSEEQISGLAKTVAQQQGKEKELYVAIADAALGLASPESIATILSAEIGGAGIQLMMNSRKVVSIISKLPGAAKIRQAADLIARNAIPGAFIGQAGTSAVEAAKAGQPVDAVVNALIAVAGTLGIRGDVKAVGEMHPPSVEVPGANPYAGPAGKRGAQATAEALEAQGQGLAAESWREVAARVQGENKPVTFQAGDRQLTLKPIGKLKGREFFTLVDDTGKELSGGTLPTVQAWMGMNLPEVKIPGGESGSRLTVSPEGKVSSAPTPYVEAIGNPTAPIGKIFSDQDALAGKILQIAESNPSFGTKKIAREAGANYADATAALDKLVQGGVIKRTQNARGSVVYHKVQPAEAAPAQPEAPIQQPAQQPPNPNDIDALLGEGDTATLPIGGQKFTVTRQKVDRGGKPSSIYTLIDPSGEVVAQAGVRKPTMEAWIAQQLAGAQPAADKTTDNQPSTKPEELPASPSVETSAPETNAGQEGGQNAATEARPTMEEAAPPSVEEPVVKESLTTEPETKPPTFEEFTNEKPREFSSTQVNLPESHIAAFDEATHAIPDEDLAEEGREVQPHVTALWGLHENNHAPVQEALKGEGPITAKLGKTSIFETPEADVVKIDVESPDLHRINGKIAKLAHTNSHPEYIPHVTIAYVAKGKGAKYAGEEIPGLTGQTITFNSLRFSGQDRSTTDIPLTGATAANQTVKTRNQQVSQSQPSITTTGGSPAEPGVKKEAENFTAATPIEENLTPPSVEPVAKKPETLVESGSVQPEGGAGEKPLQEQPQTPAGDWDAIAREVAPHGWASKRDIKQALADRGLTDTTGRNVQELKAAVGRIADRIESGNAAAEERRIAPYLDRARRDFGDSGDWEPPANNPDLTYDQAVRDAASEYADESEADTAEVENRALTPEERISKGKPDKWDYVDTISRIVEQKTGIKPVRSGASEAKYFITDGGKTYRIAAHSTQQRWADQHGYADAELSIGNGDLDATHFLRERASIEETRSKADQIVSVINGWQEQEANENSGNFEAPPREKGGKEEVLPGTERPEAPPSVESVEGVRAPAGRAPVAPPSVEKSTKQFIQQPRPQRTSAQQEVLRILSRGKTDEFSIPEYFGSNEKHSYDEMNQALISLIRSDDVKWVQMPGGGRGLQRVNKSAARAFAPPRVEQPIQQEPEAPPSVEEQPGTDESVLGGTDKLIRAVAQKLGNGESLGTNVDFQTLARHSFGNVTVTPRDKYDALEAGVNHYLAANAGKFWDAPGAEGIRALHDVEGMLPTQTTRTEEQIKEQQFSTPPSLALLGAKLLNPTKADTVLEPSAGTGNLAIWPRHAGAKVETNELAPRRAGILKLLGLPAHSVDARHLNDLLPDSVKPTAVLMNPPFSSDSRSGQHDTGVGIDHVEQALARMANGGRLVAILGTKQGDPNAPKLTSRWQKIAGKYNIRASVEIDGEAYRKYGTTFGNSVVVIDKTGATPGANWAEKVQNIVRGHFKAPEEAWDALQHIASDRQPVAEGTRQQEPERSVGANPRSSGASQPGRPGHVRIGSEPGERGLPAERDRHAEEPEPAQSAGTVPRSEPATRPAEDPGSGRQPVDNGSAPNLRGLEPTPPETTAQRERTEQRGGSFVSYQPQRLPDSWGAVAHAADIVETASMAAIDPPPITVRPNIDWELVKSGNISEVQLEAIAYAIQAHNQFLPSGERTAFFVGDGTGVGKGREIAGTILHYWNSGVRRVIWVSYSTDLKEDAERDLRDLKADIPVKLINDFKRGSDITSGDGVIFTTYQSLASAATGKDDSGSAKPKAYLRLDQLVKWAGDDPVIVFDEAHKAKNSTEERGTRGRQKASDSGLATVGLQARIPKGRVIYSSATGATDVRNLGYATRLGLWGVGSSFDTFDDFRNAIGAGGVGAMEVVARDLKAQGRYLSRFISFDGVEYREVTHTLTQPQIKLYEVAAKAWQTIFQNFNKAIEVTEGGGHAKMAAMSAFWGANQRFFRQFVTSLKMPTLLKEVAEARDANKSVVISLMGTGAAQAERELSRIKDEEGSLDDVDFSAADVLLKLVEKSFPTVKYVDSVDDRGNPTKVMLLDADGRPVESKEALELKEELLHKLQGLRFPEHPIDQIINQFGYENVAELTGRKNQFLTDANGKKEVHRRKKEGVPLDKTNISEARDFQSGKKHIAIISAAASTGISLHADKRADNQERRVHVVLETKWSADTQMQDFGRTHRTNQAIPPEYVLMSSNVGGEKRFLSTIARRLSQLGALTRGQRDAASSGDLAKYNFESEYGSAAVQTTLDAMARKRAMVLGFEGDQALVDMGLIKELRDARQADFSMVTVPNFLNRTFSLDPDRQDKTFELFLGHFESAIKSAKEGGTFDEGVEDIKAPSIVLSEPPRVVKRQEATGAKTYYYNLKEAYVPLRLPWERAQRDAPRGFYRQKESGNIYAVESSLSQETDAASGEMHDRVRLHNVRNRSRLIRKSELGEKYEDVNQAVARQWWEDELAKIPELEHRGLHIIGGSIMPVWNVLQGGAHGLKTVRLKTDDGQYIIGARIEANAIGRVLRGLGTESNIKLSPDDVQKIVMEDGEVLDLAGEMKLRRVKLSGETRMEVLDVPYNQEKTVQSYGVSKEYVQHRPRYFVNLHDPEALPKILEKYPVVGSSTDPDLGSRLNRLLSDTRGSIDYTAFIPSAWLHPTPPAKPASKMQLRKVRRAVRTADIPDTTMQDVLRKEYGIKELGQLTTPQFIDLMGKLTAKLPSGVLAMEPKGTPLDEWILSPHTVLSRSRAGQLIWREASRNYWREKVIIQRFTHNYNKATRGLNHEDKAKIALFRYVKQVLAKDEGKTGRAEAMLHAAGEDPAAVDSIDKDFLTPKQAAANKKLSELVYDPIWQRAVKEGLVPEERYIHDYLTFYRDDLNVSPTAGDRRDRAALLAAETGMPLKVADKILAAANAKKVTFGPFDFARGKFTLPGRMPLDDIAHIYIRGFARKSTQTAFLGAANALRPKIANPYLREYARMYINQYAGVPMKSSFDDWIAEKIHRNGLLKATIGKIPMSAEQLATVATSIQYLAKIGLSPVTALNNVFQMTNTLAKRGTFRTAQGAGMYISQKILPNALNPWTREMVSLRKSGVLDSMANKIERPQLSGLPQKLADAAGIMFDTTEQFNRGATFYAGYFAAKAKGAPESKAIEDARQLAGETQFFSGRLDAPLMSRTPPGRVLYQFKVFSLKTMEMLWNHMSHVERLKWILWSVAVGGVAAAGLGYFLHTFAPDSQYTQKMDEWQETMNLAAFLGLPRVAKSVGIFQLPMADQFGDFQGNYGRWWEQMAKWFAGPTISAIADTFHDALVVAGAGEGEASEKAWKFTWDLLRNWVPGGVSLRRLAQAMKEGQTTEDQLRIIFAAYDRDNPGGDGVIQAISRKFGIEKLIPDVLPDTEVK